MSAAEPQHSLSVHGYTVCTEQPLDQDESDALTAYLGLLRKAQDRKQGITNLDDESGR